MEQYDDKIICINPNTGFKKNINKSNYSNINLYIKDCLDDNGTILEINDWINSPSSGWICRSKNKIFHSKKECIEQQMKNKNVFYKKINSVMPYIPIDEKYKIHPYERKMSRVRILLITIISMTLIYLLWLFVISNRQVSGLNKILKNYIYYILFLMLLIGIFSFLFCPFNICTLDQDTNRVRINFIAHIHQQFCDSFGRMGILIPGCISDISICELTNNKYPACVKN